ncbi:DUF1615 domain-containing protein [Salinisphaera sp. Q1T1-3]|uniref:DUF1615 domain-containing protein n=1 Tax=Salinisphaera sp. Q1T1-3 TaxID=2321229 RepID=UPI0018F4B0DD
MGMAALVLAGCARWHPPSEPGRSPARIQQDIAERLPSDVHDRSGWSQAIYVALSTQNIATTPTHVCATIAVIGQESGFEADPQVSGLGRIAHDELARRARAAHVPQALLDAALRLKSSNGRTYDQRLSDVKTEGQLSDLFEDFVGRVPLGHTLLGSFNPVHTGGPMQVDVDFAKAHADDYPYDIDGSIRHEVFSRRGGVYFGVRHLLGYPADYDRPLYRFADYNAGWYASRNAAFQRAVSRLTGISLALDGDLVIPGRRRTSQTERATRTLSSSLDLDERAIHEALAQENTADFSQTHLYTRVMALADQQAGKPVARAILPGITLDSPKITRHLTTAWFAKRVASRWHDCMARDRT